MSNNIPNNNNNNKPGAPKKPKFGFNLYWIYAIIAIVLISIQLFSTFGGGMEKIESDQELKNLIVSNDVKKIEVINNKSAEIYIKEDSLSKPQFKKVATGSFGNKNKGPHYKIDMIGDPSVFEKKLENFQKSDT